jgi:hypothetical protein
MSVRKRVCEVSATVCDGCGSSAPEAWTALSALMAAAGSGWKHVEGGTVCEGDVTKFWGNSDWCPSCPVPEAVAELAETCLPPGDGD